MMELGRLSYHIGEIYDAALDPRLWPSTIEASCQLLKSCASAIAAVDVMDPSANISAQFGIDQAYLELLGNGSRHPLIKNLMRSNIGEVGSAVSKMTEEGFRNSRALPALERAERICRRHVQRDTRAHRHRGHTSRFRTPRDRRYSRRRHVA